MSNCKQLAPLIEAFVDGELASKQVLEVEQHTAECELCAERLRMNEALRTSTRRVVYDKATVSPVFEDRIRAALHAEVDREMAAARGELSPAAGVPRAVSRSSHRALPWRMIVPMAAAAAITLVWGSLSNRATPKNPHALHTAVASANASVSTVEQLIDDLVTHHASQDQPQVTEPKLVERFEPQVGVPVRVPNLKQYGARWEGGSVVPVRNYRAAQIRYRMGKHRVTLYVYDSERVPLRAKLHASVVRDVPVYTGTRRGYSIAAVEKRGVGYAVATDLNDRESAELAVATAY